MLDLIKKAALDAVDSTKPIRLLEAEVVTEPPDIKIRLKGNQKLVIPKELLIISERLQSHRRTVSLTNGFVSGTTSSNENHGHEVEELVWEEAQATFADTLKAGDRVMVAAVQGGQSFFILDRVVSGDGTSS